MSCAIDIEGDFDLLLGRRKDLIQSVFVGLCLDPRRIRETASRAPATRNPGAGTAGGRGGEQCDRELLWLPP